MSTKCFLVAIISCLLCCSLPSFAATVLPSPTSKINLNTADTASLAKSIKGIGNKRAAAIVAYRSSHGDFKTISSLSAVKGIGAAFVKSHLPQLEQVFEIKSP